MVKNPPANAGDVRDMGLMPGSGWEDPQEEEMATHSSILAWRIPWMGYRPSSRKGKVLIKSLRDADNG